MPTKKRLKDYMAEEGKLVSGELGETDLGTEKDETKITVAKRGRPITKPDSKAMIFHLPLDLIAQIDAEANRITTSNKSAFAVKVFSDYFTARKANTKVPE